MKKPMLWLLVLILVLFGPVTAQDEAESPVLEVTGAVETVESPGDGATAPTIWLHPTDLSQSLIIATDDNEGLGVYDLEGSMLQFLTEDGATSNVDLRYNFPLGSSRMTIIAAGVKDEPRIALFTVDAETRQLQRLGQIDTGIRLNGLCMYVSRLTGRYYVIANSELGELEQYALSDEDGEIDATLARAISVGDETEGCVADDALGNLFVGEEETSVIWKYGAEPEQGTQRRVVDLLGSRIVEQVEGLELYLTSERDGYLIAANEQNDSFLLYERSGDHAFVGEFKITASEAIDQVSEPNGLAVIGLPLNDRFPQGLLVTSDDVNSNPNADSNFKLVSWADVASGLDLVVDTAYDPRAQIVEIAAQTQAAQTEITVTAQAETEPVPSGTDAADDPAIWIHPTNPSLSTIIGTDKTAGLVVYNLDGGILQTLDIGRVNNVDLRYNVVLGSERVALVAATNRSSNSLVLYAIDPQTRLLSDAAAGPILSNVEEVYGVCLYRSPASGKTYAFVNSADSGEVEQYELADDGTGKIAAAVVRTFVVGSQTEGCAADDETGALYIGEEAVGIWKYGAEPDAGDERVQVDTTGPEGNLTADMEGIAIYYGSDGGGYLIASSQGSSEFVVYERQGDNAYLGTFRIVETEGVDAVSGTDGLDVTNFALGEAFPEGLLVVQDDLNIDPNENQNFKLVSWALVAEALDLLIDTTFDPRRVGGS